MDLVFSEALEVEEEGYEADADVQDFSGYFVFVDESPPFSVDGYQA